MTIRALHKHLDFENLAACDPHGCNAYPKPRTVIPSFVRGPPRERLQSRDLDRLIRRNDAIDSREIF
jgi:hypothetical protein